MYAHISRVPGLSIIGNDEAMNVCMINVVRFATYPEAHMFILAGRAGRFLPRRDVGAGVGDRGEEAQHHHHVLARGGAARDRRPLGTRQRHSPLQRRAVLRHQLRRLLRLPIP